MTNPIENIATVRDALATMGAGADAAEALVAQATAQFERMIARNERVSQRIMVARVIPDSNDQSGTWCIRTMNVSRPDLDEPIVDGRGIVGRIMIALQDHTIAPAAWVSVA